MANVTDEELVPSDRGCVPFVFDAHHTGLTDRLLAPATSRRESSLYEAVADRKFRDATVPGVLAISGENFNEFIGDFFIFSGVFSLSASSGSGEFIHDLVIICLHGDSIEPASSPSLETFATSTC